MTRAGVVAAVLLCVGCEKKVDVAQLEGAIQAQISHAIRVDCPGEIKPEAGRSFECQVELEGASAPHPLTVLITEISGDQVQFGTAWKEKLIDRDRLVKELGTQYADVSCAIEPVIARPADGVVWCTSKGRKLKATYDEDLKLIGAEIQ